MFIKIGIFLNLPPLLTAWTIEQLIDCVTLVYLIQLAAVVAYIFKVEP